MTKVYFRPHPVLCPDGKTVEAAPGERLVNVALKHGIAIEHACEKVCACTTCHVIIRKGFTSLPEAEEKEEDLLDKAWGLEASSRLSCQVEIQTHDLDVELPKYTVNQVSEG